ncbi:transporter [Photobacterium aquae]|uniref:Transporter n=1 Tax=Photobacterium aquae TaxID=1195763 RepID=A0A0J1GYA3_9GAMM|nr:PACE efflux transporter [Photobacterium aquae]KLV04628.1 transporter [Photobacterium aquae]
MRTTSDRIRHAIFFELIGLVIIVFGLSQLGFQLGHVGAVGVLFSVIATVWNFVYCKWFDAMMPRLFKTTVKTVLHRVLQSIGFEAGLLVITIPVLAWVLNVSLWQALLLDLGLVVFYLFYSYIYNWCYDWVFPVARPAK